MYLTSEKDFKLCFEFKDKDNKKWYSLKNPIKWKTKECVYVVPANLFLTDLCSIPKIFHWIWKPEGKHARSGVIHDYAYTDKRVSRLRADLEFFKCMRVDDVNIFTCSLFFICVRLFGWAYFRR